MAAPRHDWYLAQWLRTLKRRQAHLVRDLDINKSTVSLLASGKQPYDRDYVNAIADYLNLRPFELLMPPEEAMALRRLRTDMIRLAHEVEDAAEAPDDQDAAEKVSLG